eukprot:21268-Heterococcus_DN1.PRE.2
MLMCQSVRPLPLRQCIECSVVYTRQCLSANDECTHMHVPCGSSTAVERVSSRLTVALGCSLRTVAQCGESCSERTHTSSMRVLSAMKLSLT